MPEVTRCIVCEDPSFTEMLDSVESTKLTMFPDLPLCCSMQAAWTAAPVLHQECPSWPEHHQCCRGDEEQTVSHIMVTSEEAGGMLRLLTHSHSHSLSFLSSFSTCRKSWDDSSTFSGSSYSQWTQQPVRWHATYHHFLSLLEQVHWSPFSSYVDIFYNLCHGQRTLLTCIKQVVESIENNLSLRKWSCHLRIFYKWRKKTEMKVSESVSEWAISTYLQLLQRWPWYGWQFVLHLLYSTGGAQVNWDILDGVLVQLFMQLA